MIRNKDEFPSIENYIWQNPEKWEWDKLNGGVGNVVSEDSELYMT